jgi:hypothetical protein
VILLAVRPVLKGRPQYLGSDLHISQGLEAAYWQPALGGLQLCLRRPGCAQGHFDLSLHKPLGRAVLEGRPVEWKPIGEGCYRFFGSFDPSGSFELEYEEVKD